jgi:hypothetical protein
MRKVIGFPLGVGLLAGLLSLDFAAAAKPPKPTPTPTPVPTPAPTGCTNCEIVYTQATNYTNGPQDLVLIRKDGTSKTVLLAGANNVFHKAPRWAPEGQWIAFITNTTSGSSLRVIKNDSTGVANLVSRCNSYSGQPAWRPIPSSGGYWLVYYDARSTAGCIASPPPGYNTVGQNLWAVHVSLGAPILTGAPVCLTCGLNAESSDLWTFPSWSRDGLHLSTMQQKREASGVTYSFYIFDVTFGSSGTEPPALVSPGWLFPPAELDYPRTSAPVSWAHWSDSFILNPEDADGKDRFIRYEIDLVTVPKSILSRTIIAEQITGKFLHPTWSADDQQMVDDVASTGSTKTDGIYVITLSPFSKKLIASNSPRYVDSPDWKPPVP